MAKPTGVLVRLSLAKSALDAALDELLAAESHALRLRRFEEPLDELIEDVGTSISKADALLEDAKQS